MDRKLVEYMDSTAEKSGASEGWVRDDDEQLPPINISRFRSSPASLDLAVRDVKGVSWSAIWDVISQRFTRDLCRTSS